MEEELLYFNTYYDYRGIGYTGYSMQAFIELRRKPYRAFAYPAH